MQRHTAKALFPFALLCALVSSVGARRAEDGLARIDVREVAALPDATGTPTAVPPDSTARSRETVKERPEYDPDIYDEDTTTYAGVPQPETIDRAEQAPPA